MSKLNASQYDAIVFSPHLDDAVLSCGGLLAQFQNQRKKVLVVTLFTRGQELTSKSRDLQTFLKQSGVDDTEKLFLKRRREDRRAAQLLHFDFFHFNFIDALWRTAGETPLYPTFRDIFAGAISPHDQPMIEQLTAACTSLAQLNQLSVSLYAPLAIGNHVDHRLTFQIIQIVGQQLKRKVIYYEDIPYRNRVGAREKRLGELTTQFPFSLFHLSSTEATQKKEACALYATQMSLLKKDGLSTLDYRREGFFGP